MERNIRINWQAIVQQAIKRRKELGLTQKRLAALAKVSIPTVIRFESGKGDIEMSSVFAVLKPLGMFEDLYFYEDEFWVSGRESVGFNADYKNEKILCLVSRKTVEDHFGDYKTRSQLIEAVKENRLLLLKIFEEKIRSGNFLEKGIVLVERKDLK